MSSCLAHPSPPAARRIPPGPVPRGTQTAGPAAGCPLAGQAAPHPRPVAALRRAPAWTKADAAWLLMAAVWLGALSWVRPLSAPAEGRHAGIAQAMLLSGDWLVPRLDGLPYLQHPPLFHWLAAAFMAVFGMHDWAARMPSLLGALLGAAALRLFLRRHARRSMVPLALAVLCTLPFYFLGAQFANPDMLAAGCMAAGILAGADALMAQAAGRPWRRMLLTAFGSAGLGVLARGAVGVLVPAVVLVAWVLLLRRPSWLRPLMWSPGWLLLLAVAAPWFVAMQARYPEFAAPVALAQPLQAHSAPGSGHAQPFWFHVPVITGLCLPWTVLAAAWLAPQARSTRQDMRRRDVDLLMLVWLLAVVAICSVPRCKSIGDVLPALPPLAALLARGIVSMGCTPRDMRWPAAGAATMCVGFLLLARIHGSPPDARLALSMSERPGPHDRVVMVEHYYHQLPFYWQLARPVVVADDWWPAAARRGDTWRRELADAARLDPVRGRLVLQSAKAQPARICAGGRTWVVGPSNAQLTTPWVKGLTLVAFNREMAVWRHDAGAGMPANCLDGAGVAGALPLAAPLR